MGFNISQWNGTKLVSLTNSSYFTMSWTISVRPFKEFLECIQTLLIRIICISRTCWHRRSQIMTVGAFKALEWGNHLWQTFIGYRTTLVTPLHPMASHVPLSHLWLSSEYLFIKELCKSFLLLLKSGIHRHGKKWCHAKVSFSIYLAEHGWLQWEESYFIFPVQKNLTLLWGFWKPSGSYYLTLLHSQVIPTKQYCG